MDTTTLAAKGRILVIEEDDADENEFLERFLIPIPL
jgi:hypothetical protein